MKPSLILLEDRNLSLMDEAGALAQSPGFINVIKDRPVFGDEARRVSRLYPRQNFNQFWAQLSLDPIANGGSHFRHQADLAFAHLGALTAGHQLEAGAIFAVPSNFNRNQLAILLGLVQSLDFEAVGLVDLALLRALEARRPAQSVVLDLQLHQAVLTAFARDGQQLKRGRVVQLPGAGLLALQDAWGNMITDEFIRQSRFDPHHRAETEQFVHSQLEAWISRAQADNEVLLEINNKGTLFQARVNLGFFEQRAKDVLTRIGSEIENLLGGDCELVLPEELRALPGLELYLKQVVWASNAALFASCQDCLAAIRGEPGALNFVTSLPWERGAEEGGSAQPAAAGQGARQGGGESAPTHILINHRAYPLPDRRLCLGAVNGQRPASQDADFIAIDAPASAGLLHIVPQAQGHALECDGELEVRVNGEPAEAGSVLMLGDQIHVAGAAIQLIRVQ